MSDDHIRDLLRAYLDARGSQEGTPDADARLQTAWRVCDLSSREPEIGWRIIKAACDEPLSDDDLAYLSAGLFEDLMGAHGERFIERVEVFARQDARMRFVLATVWKGRMTNVIWDQLLCLRERFGIAPL